MKDDLKLIDRFVRFTCAMTGRSYGFYSYTCFNEVMTLLIDLTIPILPQKHDASSASSNPHAKFFDHRVSTQEFNPKTSAMTPAQRREAVLGTSSHITIARCCCDATDDMMDILCYLTQQLRTHILIHKMIPFPLSWYSHWVLQFLRPFPTCISHPCAAGQGSTGKIRCPLLSCLSRCISSTTDRRSCPRCPAQLVQGLPCVFRLAAL